MQDHACTLQWKEYKEQIITRKW